MRLIDADEIRKKAVPHVRGDNGTWSAKARDWAVLVGDIDDAPTVDAVEVVRCKDCIYYHKELHMGFGKCSKTSVFPYNDDFCSYGERRTENGHKGDN